MTTIRTQDLSGDALDWASRYVEVIREVIGDRRDRRPQRADRAAALERMASYSPVSLGAEQLLSLITDNKIATFEDNRVWYALPSREIATWWRNMDGDEMLAMIAEEDVVSASTLPDAVKKCLVRMVLGTSVEVHLPD